MWQKIEQWCDDGYRSGCVGAIIKASLLPGQWMDPFPKGDARRANIQAFQSIYAFYAGQCSEDDAEYTSYSGLFGAYQVYNIASDTRWHEPVYRSESNTPYIFISLNNQKVIFLDPATGQLYSYAQNGSRGDLVATPCAGGVVRITDHDQNVIEQLSNPIDGKDSILRWFEEHASRLRRNYYTVGVIRPSVNDPTESYFSLLKYPAVADTSRCSRAVTRGVEIVASAIFLSEFAEDDMFVYSIRLRLLTPDDGDEYMTPEQRGFQTCQLVSRYWKICKHSPDQDEPSIEEVRGDGVIGYYPLLHEGGYLNFDDDINMDVGYLGSFGGCFTYQSCTRADCPGSMEGYFTFIPGSRENSTGPSFDARVAPFPLHFSQFIY